MIECDSCGFRYPVADDARTVECPNCGAGLELEPAPHVSPRYLSVTETAKLIREALKRAFPGVKFSVRSDKYANGASINVGYVDGPTRRDVEKVTELFAGADFDGMVDLKIYSQHWLNPDGTVGLAHTGGGGSTIPETIGSPIGPNAELVHFGADYVFVNRAVSPAWEAAVFAVFTEKTGVALDPSDAGGFWNVDLPLSVDRSTGELYRMVDSEKSGLREIFHQFVGFREGGDVDPGPKV